jgi:hypothetical protein
MSLVVFKLSMSLFINFVLYGVPSSYFLYCGCCVHHWVCHLLVVCVLCWFWVSCVVQLVMNTNTFPSTISFYENFSVLNVQYSVSKAEQTSGIVSNSNSGWWSLNTSATNWHIVAAPVIMRMENLVEWWLVGETEVLGDNLPQCHFDYHKSHLTWPGSNRGRRGGNPATNGSSYGTAAGNGNGPPY